jgi:hypothetical protein
MANESDLQNRDDSKIANIIAVLSISVISFFILIPVVNSISVPLEKNDGGVASLVNALDVSPYTEYIKFLILLFAPVLVGVITSNVNQVLVNRCSVIINRITEKVFSILNNKSFSMALTLILVFLWSVNRNYIFLDFTLNDAFHEGEYLGFLPNFLTLRKPFLGSFMIHGFGIDVLTSLIANKLTDRSNVIALTRFFRMTEGLITYLGCFWIIWELISLSKFNRVSRQRIFLLSSILFVITDGVFFKVRTDTFAGRDTLFVLQLALIVRFFRILGDKEIQNKFEEMFLPFLIGISIPASVLYVYDRAAYFFLIYLLACVLAVFGKRILRIWFCSSILGFAISAIAVVVVLGFDQVAELSSQMSYWIRYGKYITFIPPPPFSLRRESIIFWRYFVFATLVHIFATLYLVLNYKKSHKSEGFWSSNYSIIVLLFSSLLYMRIALDRSPDAGSGSLVTVFLLLDLCLRTFKTLLENQVGQILLNPPLKQWVTLLLIIIICIHPVLNPVFLPSKLERLYKSFRTPDVKILRQDFLESYRALEPEVAQSPCFFTLSSEGFWYYLFNKQSCTKFSILAYAKTTDAQETVVREINDKKPSIILFFVGGDVIGARTPVADSNSIVYQYFLDQYKPYTLVEGRWFWKRDERKLTFTKNSSRTYGSVNTVSVVKASDVVKPGTDHVNQLRISNDLSNQIHRGDRVWLNGTSSLINQDNSTNAVYISYGEDNRLVSVGWVAGDSTWKAFVPTLSLPTSTSSVFKAWGYDAKNNQLVQIGKDIKIDLTGSA